MEPILSFEEIEKRYAPEWVLIGDPVTDETLAIQSGRVLFHSLDRDEISRKVLEYPHGRYALWFLGTFPEDMVLVL